MLQGYCYSSPLARGADHPLVPSVHLGAEWHFCSWLTEVKEANYWLSFPRGSCRRISLQANMDFSATRMVVMTVIFVELYERKQIFFFSSPVTCVDVYWKLLWIRWLEWGCVKGWIPRLTVCSQCAQLFFWVWERLRFWGFLFLLLFSSFFFAVAVNFNCRVFLIGTRCVLTLLWLCWLLCVPEGGWDGQPLQVSRKAFNGKYTSACESVSVPETCHPFTHISVGWSCTL